MYFPFLRAKQNELAALGEINKSIWNRQTVIPIIEPVVKVVPRQYKAISDKNVPFIIIVNPLVGELASSSPHDDIHNELIKGIYDGYKNYWLGFIIHKHTIPEDIKNFVKKYPSHYHAFIHFNAAEDSTGLVKAIKGDKNCQYNIFIEGRISNAYINMFSQLDAYDIIIKDGFKKCSKNEYYPSYDFFYDLHKIYESELGYDGFGDFTIIGSQYEKGGGPAYVVAIHITTTDENDDLIVRHFKSDVLNPPSSIDVAGKFLQALGRAMVYIEDSGLNTDGISNYQRLHMQKHFPGLGIAKKLSIMHHIEFMYGLIN